MNYYLGVDGGGTKTEFVLLDDDLRIAGRWMETTTDIGQVGEAGIRKILCNNLEEISRMGIDNNKLKYVSLGLSNFGEIKSISETLRRLVEGTYSFTRWELFNDVKNCWAGALGCQNGIAIIAGTGSIGYMLDDDGKEYRAGGFGEIIGDDGSAYWIGLRAVQEYTKQKDGRKPVTVLLRKMEEHLHIIDEFEIIDIMETRHHFNRQFVASLAAVAYSSALDGCEVCRGIYKDAAYELYLHVKALAEKGRFNGIINVSYSGGVFKSGDLILNPLSTYLEKYSARINFFAPLLGPAVGTALYAYMCANHIPPSEELITKIKGHKQ